MRLTTVVLLLAAGFVIDAHAQTWVRQFGSNGSGEDVTTNTATDDAGNLYVVGATSGVLSGEAGQGSVDAFLLKFDSTGSRVWARQFGSGRFDYAAAVAVDASGVYVSGYTLGTLAGQTSMGNRDAFLRKYDANGNLLWTRQFGTSGSDSAGAVIASGSAVYVGGTTDGAFPGQANAGSADAFLRKYDLGGTELWTRQFGTTGQDDVQAAAADATGVYIAGVTVGATPGNDAYVRKYDAAGGILWNRTFGTSAADEAIALAINGGAIYVAGYTIGTLPGQTSSGASDAFVRKYNAGGTEQWTRQFGTSQPDSAMGLAASAAGVYVVGGTRGSFPTFVNAGGMDLFVTFYPADGGAGWTRQAGTSGDDTGVGAGADASGVLIGGLTQGLFVVPSDSPLGNGDTFLRKYTTGGADLWTRQYGSAGANDFLRAVAVNGSVYVAGTTEGTLPGQASAGRQDAYLRKYDAAGTEIWTRQFGSASFDTVGGLALDGTGVYVAGTTDGVGGGEAFVRRYDESGTLVWERQFGTTGNDQGLAIALSTAGVFVSGMTTGVFPTQANSGGFDVFVRLYDRDGNVTWTRQFGTAQFDTGVALAADASGAYVSGYTEGTLPGQASAGSTDGFLRKYDASGNTLWTRQFGTNLVDYVGGAAADATGIYLAGSTTGTFSGQSSAGADDAFLRKYDASGNVLWTRQFGSADIDWAAGVAADSSGVYVGGATYGVLPGQVRLGEETDLFLRKYDPAGNTVWTRQLGTQVGDMFGGVAVGTAGLFVGASTPGLFPGQAGSGGYDAAVIRFDPLSVAAAVTIATNPAGLQIVVDGFTFNAPQTFGWVSGDSHTVGVSSPQGSGAPRYVYTGWSDGLAQSHAITVPTIPATYTANFATQYRLTTVVGPAGAGTVTAIPASADGYYNSGQSVQLTAAANASYQFANWAGSLTGTANPQSVIMTAPRSATAVFTATGNTGLHFKTVTPCRVVDTRNANGPFGGPMLSAGVSRTFNLPQGACGIPGTARAYSLNVTVVPPGFLGYLTVWPTGLPQPGVSTLNALDGQVTANAAIVPAGTGGAIDVYALNATHVIIDINGYFDVPQADSLAFYPVTPCRVADTRGATGAFGGPALAAGVERSFAIPQSACNIPATAQAYAMNVTVVPPGFMGYITAWPTGLIRPDVSTTNALDGTTTANMAIVPAGTAGAVSFYAMNDTHLVVDINGYFAPPGSPGALKFYTLPPCRLADTRGDDAPLGGPILPAATPRTFPVATAACGLPAVSQAHSLNFTVVPPGFMGYLTAWPAGQTMPVVSTLNALDGQVTANAALIPAGANGAINAYTMNPSHLVIDVNGYFAQ